MRPRKVDETEPAATGDRSGRRDKIWGEINQGDFYNSILIFETPWFKSYNLRIMSTACSPRIFFDILGCILFFI